MYFLVTDGLVMIGLPFNTGLLDQVDLALNAISNQPEYWK